jgi:hypothetical protein
MGTRFFGYVVYAILYGVLMYGISLMLWLLPLYSPRSWAATFTSAFFSWCIALVLVVLWRGAIWVWHRRRLCQG